MHDTPFVATDQNDESWYDSLKQYFFIPGVLRHISTCWESVLALGEPFFFKKGTEFKHQSGYFYYIKKGSLESVVTLSFGNTSNPVFLEDGCLHRERGMASAFAADRQYCRFAENSEVYRFSVSLCDETFYAKYPSLALNLFKSVTIKHDNSLLFSMLYQRPRAVERLAWYIYIIFRLCGDTDICRYISHEKTSILLSMSRASLMRAINTLKEMGAVDMFSSRGMRIRNPGLLRELVAGYRK